MIFVGIDWAERHHDVCVIDADGQILTKARIIEGLDGVARLHTLSASMPQTRMTSWSASRPTAGYWSRPW